MKVIFLGPPGAGKGTQAERLRDAMDMVHVSTGDLLRKNIKEGTSLGAKAQGYMTEGKLVPDDLIIDMVQDFLEKLGEKNILFDGFPRTLVQAEKLDEMLSRLGSRIDQVINLKADDEKIVVRITGRRLCSGCGATYHLAFHPSKQENICDACGQSLMQRSDDTEEVVRKRIEVYQAQTMPLIEYYKKQQKLSEVNGDQAMDQVYQEILQRLGK